jgi:hypothetical protein
MRCYATAMRRALHCTALWLVCQRVLAREQKKLVLACAAAAAGRQAARRTR